MNDYAALLRSVQKLTIFFLSICFFGWALVPEHRPFWAGWIVGSAVGLVNTRYLAWKVHQVGEAAVERSGKKINMGFFTRAAMALLAVVVAIKFKQHIAFSTTLAGLFFAQLATLLLGILSLFRK